jgi:hypothetical protein
MPRCYCSALVQEHDGEIVLTVYEKDSKDQVEVGKYLSVFFHDKGLEDFEGLSKSSFGTVAAIATQQNAV